MSKFKTVEEKSKEEKPKKKSPNPKGNQRTRVAKAGVSLEETKKRAIKEKANEENKKNQAYVKNQLEIIGQKFLENPEPFFEAKEKEIAKVIAKYGNLQVEDIENGVMNKKDYSIHITHHISKPIFNYLGQKTKYNSISLQASSDFYWERVVLPLNEKIYYIPMIQHYLGIIGISSDTFQRYIDSGDEQIRETCKIIIDKFIAYYQNNAMQKHISEIMTMFVLKTTFKQKENEQPIINNFHNTTITPNEKVNKLLRDYGKDAIIIETDD